MTEHIPAPPDAPAPSSRPRQRRKDARPGEIIEAGIAEFGARGFEAARMEDVARRAGVAKGTVFLYFPTKEALFEAALVSRIEPSFARLTADGVNYSGPALDLLLGIFASFYEQLERPEVVMIMRIIIAEGPRFPQIVETYHRLSVARAQAAIQALVERGVASGEFRAGAIRDIPMLLAAPCLMAAVWRMTFDRLQPVPLERFRAAHMEMVRATLQSGLALEAGRP